MPDDSHDPTARPLAALPELFLTRLRALVPAERLDAVEASFALDKPIVLRPNGLRAVPATTLATLAADGFALTALADLPDACSVPSAARAALTAHPLFAAGAFYIQNPSSMLAAHLLGVQPGEEVLDLAAAPGSKTSHLAALMGNTGRITAVEVVKARYYRLKANLVQQGVTNTETYLMDGRSAGYRWPERFDRVLLDAPCSSEGRFTRLELASWQTWSPRKIKEMAHKQRKLLRAGLYALKPGGVLLYSTCSFAPEENEAIVSAQLEAFGAALSVQPLTLPSVATQPGLPAWERQTFDPAVAEARRVLPDHLYDGFFYCLLRKHTSFEDRERSKR